LALLSSQFSFAQNWRPVNKDYTYNFSYPKGVCTIHTIADSFISHDSIYYLNHSAKMVSGYHGTPDKLKYSCYLASDPTKPAVINTHQFISKIKIQSPGNYYIATNDTSFSISTQTATVLAAQKDSTVFGISDSIRTIQLSSGTKIIISKSFGILNYPVNLRQPDSGYYTLIGINEINKGVISADSMGTFNFNVGDKFEFNTGIGYDGG